MQGGNGHRPVNVVREKFGRTKPSPRGPFNGALVVQALEQEGWTPTEASSSDEWTIWRRGTDGRVPMNPDWREFWEDDPIFRCLCRDMDLSADELATLLDPLR